VGKQKIEDTGAAEQGRACSGCDDEFVDAGDDVHQEAEKADDKPFFVWLNFHAHALVHAHENGKHRPGGALAVAVSRHDDRPLTRTLARCWILLDELGIAEDTFVMYSTDNGPHRNSWPDGGMTPFRSEKEHQLGGRVSHSAASALARQGEGRIGVQRHHPASRLAADVPGRWQGAPEVIDELKKGYKADRSHVQEPHRRLRLPALPQRQGEGGPSQVLLLLQRRRRRAGTAL
jgi:arylsulfatase